MTALDDALSADDAIADAIADAFAGPPTPIPIVTAISLIQRAPSNPEHAD